MANFYGSATIMLFSNATLLSFQDSLPENFNDIYLADEGKFLTYYIFAHYAVYII